MDIRKSFSTRGVVGHRNKLPREVIAVPSLSQFRKHLENALRHMEKFLRCPAQCQGLDLMMLMGPF